MVRRFDFHKTGDFAMLRLLSLLVALFLAWPAFAADMAVKAPPRYAALTTYPTGCGFFYGLQTSGVGGTATSSSGNSGLLGGNIGANVGYTCPIGKTFAFIDAMVEASSVGGKNTVSGFSFNTSVSFEQRFALGVPLSIAQQFADATAPGLNAIAMPSIPPLPNGWSVGPANPYAFVSLHEDDVTAVLAGGTGHSYLVSYGTGIGNIFRTSNGWVIDIWAEYVNKSTGLIVGPKGGGFNFGNGFKVGAAVKF